MTPQQKYAIKNREKINKTKRELYAENKEEIKEKQNVYRKTSRGKESQRKSHIKYRYNLTVEEYNQLLLKQNSVCALCLNPEQISGTVLCVDHCHSTGKVRGLLCRMCNSALGKFKDDKDILKRAVEYLEND